MPQEPTSARLVESLRRYTQLEEANRLVVDYESQLTSSEPTVRWPVDISFGAVADVPGCDCSECRAIRNARIKPKSTAQDMKYKYTHEGRTLAIGDRIGEYTIADFSGTLIRTQERLPTNLRYLHYDTWVEASALGVAVHTLPTTAAYDRITGERIVIPSDYSTEGALAPSGHRIHYLDQNSRNVDLCVSYGGEVAYSNSAQSILDAGLEIRSEITWDIADRVPRSIRHGVSRVKVGRSFVPAADAVWSRHQKKYILLSEAVPVASSWVHKDCEGLIRFVDDTYGIRGTGYEITGGPNAGRFVRSRRDRWAIGGYYYPVSELIPIYYNDPTTPYEYVKGIPLDSSSYELIDNEWCVAGEAVTLVSGERVARHRAMRVFTYRDSRRAEAYIRAGDLDDVASYCEDCGSWYLNEAVSGDCCHGCSVGSRTRIRSYNNGTANYLTPKENVPIKFGIELEVGCDKGYSTEDCAATMADALSGEEDFVSYGVFKHDGSIQCGGFEVVTRPDSPAVHKEVWSRALANPAVRQKMSSWTNSYCGMHIHVSREPLSALWIGRILVAVNSPEMSDLVTAVAGRGSVRYAQRMDKRLTSGKSRYGDRYEAVNTTGDRTIEFRIFRGTLDPRGFLRNVEFVEAVLAFTRPASVSLREVGSLKAFVEFVSKSRKSYPVLFEFLASKGFFIDHRKPATVYKDLAVSGAWDVPGTLSSTVAYDSCMTFRTA